LDSFLKHFLRIPQNPGLRKRGILMAGTTRSENLLANLVFQSRICDLDWCGVGFFETRWLEDGYPWK